jgi:threonylcarbamoyladenosine tRNA methylthiotransferase MtaB
MHGFSKNYVKVRTAYDPLLVNEVVPVKFLEISENGDVDIEELPEVLAH